MTHMTDYLFKTQPYRHQLDAFNLSRDREAFALLMEQGTGKTKVAIDTAAWNYSRGRIDTLLVIAPNGVHRNWVTREVPAHLPDHVQYQAAFWQSGSAPREREFTAVLRADGMVLRVLALNVEYLSTEPGKKLLASILRQRRCMLVVDESSTVKTPGAARTKALVSWAKYAPVRRILTGTPVTQSPLDLYSQFKVLSPDILGFTTFTEFRSEFAVVEKRVSQQASAKAGREVFYDDVVGYKNLPELTALIAPHSFRVRKENCLDLPPKVYRRRPVDLSPEQRRIYKALMEESVASITHSVGRERLPQGASAEDVLLWAAALRNERPGDAIVAKNTLEKILRLQQVLSGIAPGVDGGPGVALPGPNPRLNALEEDVGELTGQVIIWARFQKDIEWIADRLGRHECCLYYGPNPPAHREAELLEWRSGFRRFFISNAAAGGYGLTLNEATNTLYYTNSYSLEHRLQSEDRNHRIGQTVSVTYSDFEADGTIDSKIIDALREKRRLSDAVLDENTTEGWLT